MKHSSETLLNNCPVCDSSSHAFFKEVTDHSVSQEVFKLHICNDCGLVFTNPRPDEDSIGGYYESEEYISHSNTSKGLIAKIYQQVRSYTVKQKRKLVQSCNQGSSLRILDYGCGTGEFLNEMSSSGYHCTGIEPSEKASKFATKSYSLDVLKPEQLQSLPEASYDIITMWHVMEHVHDLNETIQLLKQKLKKDGHLIIAVPNQSSWDACHYQDYWAAYDVPRHLYHFTSKSVGKLLSQHGFILSKILPMKWDAFYVSLLSEKYKKNPLGPLLAFIIGWRSNLAGMMNIKKYSSLIYIARSAH